MASSLKTVSDAAGHQQSDPDRPNTEAHLINPPSPGSTDLTNPDTQSPASSHAKHSQEDETGLAEAETGSKQKPARWTRSTRRTKQK